MTRLLTRQSTQSEAVVEDRGCIEAECSGSLSPLLPRPELVRKSGAVALLSPTFYFLRRDRLFYRSQRVTPAQIDRQRVHSHAAVRIAAGLVLGAMLICSW